MIRIFVDVAELNRNKRDEDRKPIMVAYEDGKIEYYSAVCFTNGRVIYYPGGQRIGEDVVRVAVEVDQITMTDPLPDTKRCTHGVSDPLGCDKCDMNIACAWAEGGDCQCTT